MTKLDIFYNDLLRLLEAIYSDREKLEEYSANLDDVKQDDFIELIESIESETTTIKESRDLNLLHQNYLNLVRTLNKFKTDFADVTGTRINEILLLIELITKVIASEEEITLSETVDTSIFALVSLEKAIFAKNYIFHDTVNLANSIVLLDMSNIRELSTYLDNNSVHIELYLHLIQKVGEDGFSLNDTKYVLVDSSLKNKPASIWACLALHLIKDGEIIHEPNKYFERPIISEYRKVSSGLDYQQFNDTLYILSEYNDEKDILNKYLRLYHVIENFMYKYPLVKLERDHNGAIFSIRDFQRIYESLKKSEISSISKLIKRICSEEYSPLRPSIPATQLIPATADSPEIPARSEVAEIPPELFGSFIYRKFVDLINLHSVEEAHLNDLLKYLRVPKNDNEWLDYNEIVQQRSQVSKYFSLVLYGFRNSLVHNRETEFHLTHNTLISHPQIHDTCHLVLKNLLIPVIEEIVFFLVTSKNEIVWYQNSKLTLFTEG